MKSVQAWHFLPADKHLRWNGQEVKVGQTIGWDGPLVLCQSGLHASIKALDALSYAPGPVICRVELSGEIIESTDKLVASRRTCLAMNDAAETLRFFARWCALSVIDKWDAPQVVLNYLMTGDKTIQDAARAAAWTAAWTAAWAAARAAAWAAAWDAARAAARAAAGDARAAAWDAARAAAWDAAGAAWAAAWDAAGDARAAAWAAARAAQEAELSRLLYECLEAA